MQKQMNKTDSSSSKRLDFFLRLSFLMCNVGFALSSVFFAYFLSESIFAKLSPNLYLYSLAGAFCSLALTITIRILLRKRAPSDWTIKNYGSFQVLWSFFCLFYSLFLLYFYIRRFGPFNATLSNGKYGFYCLAEVIACGFAFFVPFLLLIPTRKERESHDQAI